MLMPLLLVMGLTDVPSVQVRATADRVEVVAHLAGRLLADVPNGVLKPEQGERWLRFCLIDAGTGEEGPAMLGAFRREQTKLLFVPRYPLTAGQRYRAVLELGGGKTATAEHRAPAAASSPAPAVEQIYPTASVLPANQLKFYLHFSKPMRETRSVFDQIKLLDEDGKPAEEPWRRTELWSADSRRLTLWIHPGRIKRGVGPREQEGPVLMADRKYRLVIGAEVEDANGQPMGRPFTKTFRTAAEKRTRPLPEQWTLRSPTTGTREPLTVEFREPLDRALLDRFLIVKDARGKAVAGRIEVGKEEKSWRFHPEKPWEDAGHTLTVDGQLEDLAGNTPVQLFDVDLKEKPPAPPKLVLPFRPRS
jgi:hypothetical protein